MIGLTGFEVVTSISEYYLNTEEKVIKTIKVLD